MPDIPSPFLQAPRFLKDGEEYEQLLSTKIRRVLHFLGDFHYRPHSHPHAVRRVFWLTLCRIYEISHTDGDHERDSFVAEWKHAVSYRLGRVFA
jgi:hypothetical protein